MERRGYALELAYLGTGFSGFARQPGRRTVEGVLKQALEAQGLDVPLAVAARTDAGVHARRQCVSFRARQTFDVGRLQEALSNEPDLKLLGARPVDRSFHARASAHRRQYVYRLRIGGPASAFRWVLAEQAYDWEAARAFLAAQLGTLDRRPFTRRNAPSKATTLLAASLSVQGRRIAASFTGDGFTRHLIRNWMRAAIAAASSNRVPAMDERGFLGQPAPAAGLCLWSVDYGGDSR